MHLVGGLCKGVSNVSKLACPSMYTLPDQLEYVEMLFLHWREGGPPRPSDVSQHPHYQVEHFAGKP
jgi:hypothetical protein